MAILEYGSYFSTETKNISYCFSRVGLVGYEIVVLRRLGDTPEVTCGQDVTFSGACG